MTDVFKIKVLVELFQRNLDSYRSGKYNETQLRREFVDPFFKALGWDVDNEQGYAEAYKDVIHEDSIYVGGATKAPDYCFRIGGVRKFFIEAKKPSVDIREDTHPAYQLRRYAWSAKLPLSILTDFAELAVYDCRIKPMPQDKASTARILYMTCNDYAERWQDLSDIFSKDALLRGSFDRWVESTRLKKGTAEVDDAFLVEIERWRDELARILALRNPKLLDRQLNFAVQKIIDRIIFLRICEDRGIEPYGRLQALINGANAYKRLCQLFRDADDRYNSGLFHFKDEKGRPEPPDDLTLHLSIDDDKLKYILKDLYYPESPYEFSVLPADILGQVYEQFLGKVIRLTEGHQAKIDWKPEVKKAHGVYYTPTYIVSYIVKNTVGKLCEGKTPVQVAKLKILDPACGSGSFLLGAYQHLLDWYRDYYVEDGPQKHRSLIYQAQGGEWRLTTEERKRILLNNIYGVDIDSQAVEVTKLSLLLKVLEGENNETLNRQLRFIHERALPDLGANIKCGNSLIGSDFFVDRLSGFSDEEERLRINPFDWEVEFAAIMKSGGFDAVIGNPPYIFTRELLTRQEKKYYSFCYKANFEKKNTYMLFMEKMLVLMKQNGKGSYIVPNSWLTIESGKLLRDIFIPKLEEVVDLNYPVFKHVSMEPCIFAVTNRVVNGALLVARVKSQEQFLKRKLIKVDRKNLSNTNRRIVFSDSSDVSFLLNKVVASSRTLISAGFDSRSGLQAYEKGKGNPPQTAQDVKKHVFDRDHREDENSLRYLQGENVGRYILNWSGMWMQYGPWLSQPREIEIFTRPRILLREITSSYPRCLNATLVEEIYLNNKSILNILHTSNSVEELIVLLGITNCNLMSLFYKSMAVKAARNIFPKVVVKNLREFPYPRTIGKVEHARMVHLVEQMLNYNKELHKRKLTEHEREILRRQIDATDHEIDKLVYTLYDLSEDEIKIVERK